VASKNDLGDEVPKVIVHRVRVYDHHIGTVVVSPRMATEEGAKVMGGQIVPDTAVEIDAGLLETGEQWTRLDFDPDRV
jgi:hypothetical protein